VSFGSSIKRERSVCFTGILADDVTAWIRFEANALTRYGKNIASAMPPTATATMNTNAICEISWPKNIIASILQCLAQQTLQRSSC
jgi:hypothetical protein